jgi:ribosome-binding protein aMBF1 (putative translation factor)
MDTCANIESSSVTTPKETVITLSPSQIELTHTSLSQPIFKNLSVDTSSATFHTSLDLGVAETGTVVFRATLFKPDGTQEQLKNQVEESCGTELGVYLRRLERNPARAHALAGARQRLAQSMIQTSGSDKPKSLAALRLQAGLSQTQLADKLRTQQPSVARFEKDPSAMQFPTMSAIAEATKTSVGTVAEIIQAQVNSAKRHERQAS